MYPLKFEHLYYKKVWGGRDFQLFREDLPEGDIGETWDVACHKNGTSVVSNGQFKGMRLDELINVKGEELLGKKIDKKRFPLLVKLINATNKLSIQVHPNDDYADEVENEMGKNEVWYVVEAFKGASLIIGTKEGCTVEDLKKSIAQGTLEEYVNRIPVKKGEVYFIKSGLIHAICEGVIIAEIQQNSDVTYRVYDYNRGRELHIKKALEVVDLRLKGEKSTGLRIDRQGYSKTYLCLLKEFSLESYDIKSSVTEQSDEDRFYIFTCVEGQGEIMYKYGSENIKKGDSILIPAYLGIYTLRGRMRLLKSYVPDCNKVEEEILKEIRRF